MNTLEKVRAKIIEAVPEIVTQSTARKMKSSNPLFCRPITLEDVLRAIEEIRPGNEYEYGVYGSRMTMTDGGGKYAYWHLGKPLEEQSPETIEFIGSVLSV